eukprot:13963169-Alexandrium_andersonii.AAC.1
MLSDAKLQQAPREEAGAPTETPLNVFQKARFRRFRQACRVVVGLDWADPEPPSVPPGGSATAGPAAGSGAAPSGGAPPAAPLLRKVKLSSVVD